MAETALLEPTKTTPRKRPPGAGGAPKLTMEHLELIAQKRGRGLSLNRSLALVNCDFTLAHWNRHCLNHPRFARLYEQRVSYYLEQALDTIWGTTRQTLPVGTCWALERGFPDEFGQNRKAGDITINNNTVIAVQDQVMGRVASLVRKGIATDKAGILRPDKASARMPAAQAQAIDVESSPG